MRRNTINLFIAITALLLVTACFCRSGRDDEASNSEPPVTATTPEKFTTTSAPAPSGDPRYSDKGDFVVVRPNATTARFQKIEGQVQTERLLEKAADQLNRALKLPNDIKLLAKDCGEQNAFYDPNERTVTICYELMQRFYETFKLGKASDETASAKMFDAIRFVFLHEIGHALIDVYKIPIAGNEEDAADRLSAFVNLKELGEDGVRAVFAAADAFAIESKFSKTTKRNMADEHLLQEQRFYNSLCMIYGSDPAKHPNIVSDGYLPKERAVRCQNEFKRAVESWTVLLEPWRKS